MKRCEARKSLLPSKDNETKNMTTTTMYTRNGRHNTKMYKLGFETMFAV
jgi:hypothetical protein